jgi:hypothetical protein
MNLPQKPKLINLCHTCVNQRIIIKEISSKMFRYKEMSRFIQAHHTLRIKQREHMANDDSTDAAASTFETNLLNGFRIE